jgi:hypothetical protein
VPTVKAPPPLPDVNASTAPTSVDPTPTAPPTARPPTATSPTVTSPDTTAKSPDPAKPPDPKPAVVKTQTAPPRQAPPSPQVFKVVDPPSKTAPDHVEAPTGHLVVTVANNDRWTLVVDGVDRGHVPDLVLPVGHHAVELRFTNEPAHAFQVEIAEGAPGTIRYTSVLGDLMGPGSTTRKPPTP